MNSTQQNHQSIESHDMDIIHMTGRQKCETIKNAMTSSSNHKNCFFQCLYYDAGRTFSFKIIFYFFIIKKILEGKSFQTVPSSLDFSQLGVDVIE